MRERVKQKFGEYIISVSLLQSFTLSHITGAAKPSLPSAPAVMSNTRAAQLIGSAECNLGGDASVLK